MSARILLSDNVHVQSRNFQSLFEYCALNGIGIDHLSAGKSLWNKYGDYAGDTVLEGKARFLETLAAGQLRLVDVTINGRQVNAFRMARAEILSYVLARCANWYEAPVPNDDDYIFEKLYNENKTVLCLNIAAVQYWCELYAAELKGISKYKYAVIFSGSQIYQRLLLEACRTTVTRAFVVETFQTGTEYYFEERYEPITAGPDIRLPSVRNGIILGDSWHIAQNETNKAINKLLNARNKNVTQPAFAEKVAFENDQPIVLIAAQVQNDFSILESDLEDINPQSNYRLLIGQILRETDFNIIVKTHPWERKKTNLWRSFTYEMLISFVQRLDVSEQSRIVILEETNLKKLLTQCDAFVTINSQSALEACLFGGLRPFVLGGPLYGQYGFTNDYSSIVGLVQGLNEQSCEKCLTLEAYSRFLEFAAKVLQRYLVSVHKSGMPILRERLQPFAFAEVGMALSSQQGSSAASRVDVRLSPGAVSSVEPHATPISAKGNEEVVRENKEANRPIDLRPIWRLKNGAVRLENGAIELPSGAADHRVFGPYLNLRPGCYRVRLEFVSRAGWLRAVVWRNRQVVVDVVAAGGEQIIAESRIDLTDPVDHKEEVIDFSLREETPQDLEVRLWTDGKASVSIRKAILEVMDGR